MRGMTSREIHDAIGTALKEVSRGLASGELDRTGRYYTESELRERFTTSTQQRNRRRTNSRNNPRYRSANSA